MEHWYQFCTEDAHWFSWLVLNWESSHWLPRYWEEQNGKNRKWLWCCDVKKVTKKPAYIFLSVTARNKPKLICIGDFTSQWEKQACSMWFFPRKDQRARKTEIHTAHAGIEVHLEQFDYDVDYEAQPSCSQGSTWQSFPMWFLYHCCTDVTHEPDELTWACYNKSLPCHITLWTATRKRRKWEILTWKMIQLKFIEEAFQLGFRFFGDTSHAVFRANVAQLSIVITEPMQCQLIALIKRDSKFSRKTSLVLPSSVTRSFLGCLTRL